MVKRRISLYGATGSIGLSAADVLARHADRFDVVTVSACSKAKELAVIARKLNAKHAVVSDESSYKILREALVATKISTAAGERALLDAASEKVDLNIMAISGAAGLRATFAAAASGADLALANKESIVCAGDLLLQTIARTGARLLPVDSEHNAIFQILNGRSQEKISRVTLTASGGPFRTWPAEKMKFAQPEDALAHPVWSMGAKISVDSATLMNKGLELIEAMHLFSLIPERLDVLVHPQSIVHALVNFEDGSVLAQMAVPDMRIAISSCLVWPERMESGVATLDLATLQNLSFEKPDEGKFPCLRLARETMRAGGAASCVLSAANEVAVQAFLQQQIDFNGIPYLIEKTLENFNTQPLSQNFTQLADVLAVDADARRLAASLLPHHSARARRAIA